MLEAMREQNPAKFEWRPATDTRYFIDLLAGTEMLRKGQTAEYYAACAEGGASFAEQRKPYLLY
jgi:uncharacterized protein YbbC (DUF1343 family)